MKRRDFLGFGLATPLLFGVDIKAASPGTNANRWRGHGTDVIARYQSVDGQLLREEHLGRFTLLDGDTLTVIFTDKIQK